MNFSAEIPAYLPDGFFWTKAVLSDVMLLEDRFLFSKHGPAHSARIDADGRKLTIPCHYGGGKIPISRVQIVEHGNWQNKHWGNFVSRYAHLPYFNYLAPEVEPLFQQKAKTVSELHFSIIRYIKNIWRLPVKMVLASQVFGENLPSRYVDQWSEKYSFENYLIYPEEKKYILPKTEKQDWNFLHLRVDHGGFSENLQYNALYLLFLYGTDFPGLAKKRVHPDRSS